MLLCGSRDLPAKAIVLNMKQYNGEYGCSPCLQSGKQLPLDTEGKVHVYPHIFRLILVDQVVQKNKQKDMLVKQ